MRDHGIFFKLPRSPTVASEPGICVDVICTSRTQRVVGDNSHTAYQQRLTLIRQYCLMKRLGPTLHDRIHETGSTDVLLHKGGWWVSVSPTLVESDSMNRVLSEYQKAITIPRLWFLMRR